MGYPGWHIECSAMGRKYLGDLFDIHTGGADHIPVHHENEIAQTAACTGEPGARYWMHNEFLLVDGGKMSKSMGNVYTVSDLVEKGFEPLSYRYFCHNAHYRRQLNFTWSALASAQKGLLSLRRLVQNSAKLTDGENSASKVSAFREEFLASINDDLNTPKAVALLWEASKADLGRQFYELAGEFDKVLGLDLCQGAVEEDSLLVREDLPADVLSLVKEREAARAAKEWAKSDALRQQLQGLGYTIKDTAQGMQIKRV
jgi:cysteinyl-tRNA synthetase